MLEQTTNPGRALEAIFPEERGRIVNLCAYLTGSREAAEDLAQETLIEAWRNRAKLVDPAGASPWLSAVARNMCLRWERRQGRRAQRIVEPGPEGEEPEPAAGGPDLELELEREELAELLDRALAQLPEATRAALIHRYVLELPQVEIAARLGLTEGAVEARLHRGKLSLHRLLQTDLRAEAESYGLIGTAAEGWQETRLWCPICGEHRLHGQMPGAGLDFELHCPRCSWDEHAFFAQSRRMPDELAGVKGYRAILRRFSTYMYAYIQPGLRGGSIACQSCGRPLQLRRELPAWMPGYPGFSRRGVSLDCPGCGSTSCCDLYGIALDTPEGQAFWRRNPRLRTLPEQELDFEGRPGLRVRIESRGGVEALEVILDAERYEPLAAKREGWG